jgi:hypothetical protein
MSYKHLKDWRIRTKLRIVEAMGGKCVCCAYNKHYSALELHHLDPSIKEFTLGGIRARPKSWSIIVNELRKCVLVCCLCHREIEAGIRQLPESYAMFNEEFSNYEQAKPKGFCSVCNNEYENKSKHQRFCSSECAKKHRRKVTIRPTKDEILLLLQTMSMEAVGRKYGVTGNAVRKWIK